jgi:hypothetical protein
MTMTAWTERVPLRHASEAPQRARLREPQGSDELAVAGVDTRSAVQLLDRLLEAPPCSAGELSASDRDGLLAAVHRRLWGDRIVCSIGCAACEAPYDLSFELTTLQRQLWKEAAGARTSGMRRVVEPDGTGWQLPSADEEERAAECGLQEGVAQLARLVTRDEDTDLDDDRCREIGERLEAVAPLLDIDLDTRCPECGHAQLVRFDIQSFVMQRLLDERDAVLGEVHALASGYGWSLGEIVGLPRSLRRSLVQRLGAASAAF